MLVVEDEPLLAFDYQDELETRGARPVIALTLSEGLESLNAVSADFAILDVNLGRELSWPVAKALAERGTPFLVVSGRCTIDELPEGIRPIDCIPKPIGARVLIDRIEHILDAVQ